jgi:ATP-dependent exoDNAse (exonuclease V) beta subunit
VNGLADQPERDRFVTSHGKNISVIAPAGVGKTHAIIERIVALAAQPDAVDRLARLIVVTYSVRSAQQLQQRARAAIRNAGVAPQVQRAFQQTFFGTIHSYCVVLLERFGHYLGLPSPVALLQDHDEWWNRFLLRGLGRENESEETLRELFHFYPPDKLYALGKELSPGEELPVGPVPELDLHELLDISFDGLHASTKRSLATAQVAARRWHEAWVRGDRYYPLPKIPETQKAPEFLALWEETFAPLHEWLRQAALAFGRRVANAYERFRLSEAVMTYDDQVRLALRLLELAPVRRELGEERLSVLLDEAQDTDPRQFEVLLRVAGLRTDGGQAEDQSFCIVGDFQQAIYAPRSDLSFYRRVHDEVILEPRGASSQLKVTFRCDEAIIRFVNAIFPTVLHGDEGQSAFFSLKAREGAGPGQVVRWLCPDDVEAAPGKKITADLRAQHEARFLAKRLKKLGPEAFGAASWSEVAILCPRKAWLLFIMRELAGAGLPVQLHSSDETQNDRTPGAWLTALIWVVAHPEDSFEIAGVLREIFGVADDEMARYTLGDGDRLRLDLPALARPGAVEDALSVLRGIRADAAAWPVHRIVREIVEKTGLRKRLRSIREVELEGGEQDLDDFLAVVLGRSAEGVTLAELAGELRAGLAQASPEEEEIRDAIQLLTSHKAKGLEWPVVILPFIARAIESKTLAYPRFVQGEGGREMIIRDKADYATQARAFVTGRERQQLQRLLYVMCTRARHTLVLIDDESLFAGQAKRGGWSGSELMGLLDGANRAVWKALPETLVAAPPAKNVAKVVEATAESLLSMDDLARAVARAQLIPRRITPHALAVHPPPESEPERRMDREEDFSTPPADHPGIRYGTWWHEFVQTLPWEKPRETWQRHFTEALRHSPQPGRSEREWELFCASKLAAWLAEPGRLIHREFPFLWLEGKDCFEGVMDLAVYTPAESAWQVIDWKTNRFGPGGSTALLETYRGQIEAYVRAVGKMLSVEVKGSLYLTASGEWLPY